MLPFRALLVGAGAAIVLLGGCAYGIEGSSQTISLATKPSGARCELMRNDQLVASVVTPTVIEVDKSRHDISVSCKKSGYQEAFGYFEASKSGYTWGNIVLGAGAIVGWFVDTMTGAANEYQPDVTITLSGRALARAPVGGGFPAPPFRLRGGFTVPPLATFPAAPPKIPDIGFSPVRLQASGTSQFGVEPSADASGLRPTQPYS